jgi:hypothetical protein
MKTIKLLSIGLFISGAMLFSGCKKEGCTNPDADNFDGEAKTSDFSCVYTTEVVFWFKENISIGLQAAEIGKLDFLLNEEQIGQSGTDMFWEEAPECGTIGTIKFTRELTESRSEPFYYTVKDEEGFELWKGLTVLDIDSCRVIQLEDF